MLFRSYIPNSLSEDGDPLDVLVITPVPLISGSVMRCRPVSLLDMTDDCGPDPKVLAVPLDDMTNRYQQIREKDDLPEQLLHQIALLPALQGPRRKQVGKNRRLAES